MFRPALLFAFLCLLPPASCARQTPPPATAPDAPVESPSVEQSAAGKYSGKTRLTYEDSHGNQVVYRDPSGRFFLWYPGNRDVVSGDWQVEAPRICFRYDQEYTYNPVTGEYSRNQWECRSLAEDDPYVVDAVPGDVFDLATGRVPFRLPAHPRYNSIADVKPLR